MRPFLSAVLIARDEAQFLPRCLASIRPAVDEIILLDTGSKDATVPIAEAAGARVFHTPWPNDFAAARNAALAHSTGEWILWIDADEELVVAPDRLRAMLTTGYGAYDIEIDNLTDDNEAGNRFVHRGLRLFRRTRDLRWQGAIHEQVVGYEEPIVRVEGPFILHHGYRPAIMLAKNKAERTIQLLEAAVLESPEDAFQLFNLANALLVDQRPEEAYPIAVRSTERLPIGVNYGWIAWHVRIQCAPGPAIALEDANLAERAGWGSLFVDYERAQALLRLGRFDETLDASTRALSGIWPADSPGDRGILTHKIGLVKAQALLCLDRNVEALDEIERAAVHCPDWAVMRRLRAEAKRRLGLPSAADFRAAWEANAEEMGLWAAWTQACEAEGDMAGLLAAYQSLALHQDPTPGVLVNWGRALEEAGEFDRALDLYEEAVRREPEDVNACLNCADAFARRGQWADAAHLYETALRLAPNHAQAWFTLGNAYAHAGHPDAAIRAYDQCLNLEPTHEGALYNRSIVADDRRAA